MTRILVVLKAAPMTMTMTMTTIAMVAETVATVAPGLVRGLHRVRDLVLGVVRTAHVTTVTAARTIAIIAIAATIVTVTATMIATVIMIATVTATVMETTVVVAVKATGTVLTAVSCASVRVALASSVAHRVPVACLLEQGVPQLDLVTRTAAMEIGIAQMDTTTLHHATFASGADSREREACLSSTPTEPHNSMELHILEFLTLQREMELCQEIGTALNVAS